MSKKPTACPICDGKPDPRITNPPVPGHILVRFQLEGNSMSANANEAHSERRRPPA